MRLRLLEQWSLLLGRLLHDLIICLLSLFDASFF
jgi:hypothetical protein